MSRYSRIWSTEIDHLKSVTPDHPVLYFSPETLADTARRFRTGFPGLVTYAVKANDNPAVIDTLAQAGIRAFDVASPAEIALVRAAVPGAALHYNNPVRSRAEIDAAVEADVASYSVDGPGELAKLSGRVPEGREVSVRLALPVPGAAYDFGAKFGEPPEGCVTLLQSVVEAGFTPAMTFHPGTQCTDPGAWGRYIETCAEVARQAGVRLSRLNVGGGFPSDRGKGAALEPIFAEIARATALAFPDTPPRLVCEPGRAMVAESFSLAVRVKALRECGGLFLNDGIYGLLAEVPIMGPYARLRTVTSEGRPRNGAPHPRVLYGPTCDSLDRLPGEVGLPGDVDEGDFLIFDGMGAYSTATNTRFNGYGAHEIVTVRRGGHRATQS
ncbi:type III PLP-dependent enzyme [Maritimibacter sp. UBA3975]|uniref:type III PLP-dependent enzyme n=1 Tax=Maritimibacter sp. UBA3975 TaxID=1946833 RepID=UPI000C090307|nr:type III PLP-dependent enzyme [Maritimibacter sp. UBA3975]MAM62591.1 ornithine decarboxylase [Maritimibacter sp.]|tara:strand:+ start:5512 stop:6663 length:1152 start_codon:yes stop_codon:yes gene_type:complete